jgi:hypothetical protein
LAHCVSSQQTVYFKWAFSRSKTTVLMPVDRATVRTLLLYLCIRWIGRSLHLTTLLPLGKHAFIKDQESLITTTTYTETVAPARGAADLASYEHEIRCTFHFEQSYLTIAVGHSVYLICLEVAGNAIQLDTEVSLWNSVGTNRIRVIYLST